MHIYAHVCNQLYPTSTGFCPASVSALALCSWSILALPCAGPDLPSLTCLCTLYQVLVLLWSCLCLAPMPCPALPPTLDLALLGPSTNPRHWYWPCNGSFMVPIWHSRVLIPTSICTHQAPLCTCPCTSRSALPYHGFSNLDLLILALFWLTLPCPVYFLSYAFHCSWFCPNYHVPIKEEAM